MNYLQELTTRLQISRYGYKTPQSVIEKLTKGEQLPQVYKSNSKSIYANPPYNDANNRIKS